MYERRRAVREERIRSEHPKAGGLILVATDEPASTRSWQKGAEGERTVGERLDGLAERGLVEVLHDRRVPGSRAKIDHIVIGRLAVFVVDTKNYKGRIERRSGGSLPDRLFVNGRDQTRLVEAMAGQIVVVRQALHQLYANPPIVVTPVLCLVNPDWHRLSGPGRIGEVHVVSQRGLERLVLREGPIGMNQRLSLARRLAAESPPA